MTGHRYSDNVPKEDRYGDGVPKEDRYSDRALQEGRDGDRAFKAGSYSGRDFKAGSHSGRDLPEERYSDRVFKRRYDEYDYPEYSRRGDPYYEPYPPRYAPAGRDYYPPQEPYARPYYPEQPEYDARGRQPVPLRREEPKYTRPVAAPAAAEEGVVVSVRSPRLDLAAVEDQRLRYFVARCNYYDQFSKCKRDGVWRAPLYIAKPIQQALDDGDRAVLLFSVHGSQYFQGAALVDAGRAIEYPNFEDKLARIPLSWLVIGDLPYTSAPHVEGMISEKAQGLTERFEVPPAQGREFLAAFEKFHRLDRTRGLGLEGLEGLARRH